jgi:gliding motility-associated-like protein
LIVSGAYTYKWNTDETTDTIYVRPEWATTYSVIGTDKYGCQSTESFAINEVRTLPVPAITGKPEICYGDSLVLRASGGVKYQWSHNAPLLDSTIVAPVADSVFRVTVTGANGCHADASMLVKVNVVPLLEPMTDTIICPGQHIVLQAKASGVGLTYLWSTGEKTEVIELTPTEKTDIWVKVFNLRNCAVKENILIEVLPLPGVNITGPRIICAGSELTLTASGAESYLWNSGFIGSVYTTKPVNNNEYTVTGTNKDGCKATASTTISIVDNPVAAISVNPKTVWDNESDVHFETLTEIEEYSVLWDFGDGIWSTFTEVDHHYHITGDDSQYNVVFSIVDHNGCVDTIRETINIDVHPPTVFFPNLSQVFMNNCVSCENIEIYDRRGIRLHEGPSGWDGTYKGRLLDPDTYFYVIKLKFNVAGTNIRKGYITIGKDSRMK